MSASTEPMFEFRIRQHLKRAWRIYTEHVWFFLAIAGVMVVLNIAFNTNSGFIVKVLAGIASLVWSYISLSSALAAVDGKNDMLQLDVLKLLMPSWQSLFRFVAIIFGSAIIIGVGLILLVLPGIYFAVRLMFANFALVDRKEGVAESMRFSWHMIKKDIFWTALLCFAIATMLIILGVAILGVGIFITYPIALLFLAMLYRELVSFQRTAVVGQPAELSAPAIEG